ncbi:MAG: anthranilate synthase component II [Chlamydiales bacterium]
MILIIDNYDSFTFNLYQICATIYPNIKIVRNDCIDLYTINPNRYRGIIISPGPGSPEQSGLCIPIVQKFSGSIPILGICLGHQIIAKAFGGTVQAAHTIMHGKRSILWHSQIELFAGVINPLHVGRYHSLMVSLEDLPPIFRIDAMYSNHSIMAIRHKIHLTYGLQFHPESYLSEDGSVIIRNFLNICGVSNFPSNIFDIDRLIEYKCIDQN